MSNDIVVVQTSKERLMRQGTSSDTTWLQSAFVEYYSDCSNARKGSRWIHLLVFRVSRRTPLALESHCGNWCSV